MKRNKIPYISAICTQIGIKPRWMLCVSPQIIVDPDGQHTDEDEITVTDGDW